jgi:hypothetical protein
MGRTALSSRQPRSTNVTVAFHFDCDPDFAQEWFVASALASRPARGH